MWSYIRRSGDGKIFFLLLLLLLLLLFLLGRRFRPPKNAGIRVCHFSGEMGGISGNQKMMMTTKKTKKKMTKKTKKKKTKKKKTKMMTKMTKKTREKRMPILNLLLRK